VRRICRFGENPHGGAPAGGASAKVSEILERIDAILKAPKEVRSDIQQHLRFAEIGSGWGWYGK
jgi:hypothetical protein